MHVFDRHHGLRRIARTGFLASVVSYAAFWLADAARPGFVSRSFSVHVFLLAALAFGALWLRTGAGGTARAWTRRAAAIPLSLAAAVLVWNLGAGFGDARLLAAIAAAAVPPTLLRLLTD